MKVMFHMLPGPGHMNPSFALARALRDRDHDVVYGSTLDFEQEVTRRGFGFVPFHRDVYPRGWGVAFARLPMGEARSRATRLSQTRRAEDFLSGQVEDWVRRVDPDVVVTDVSWTLLSDASESEPEQNMVRGELRAPPRRAVMRPGEGMNEDATPSLHWADADH